MTRGPTYLLRLVDRGLVWGVPCVDVYLIRVDGDAESCAMHNTGLSPVSADHLAESFAALGVRVERELRALVPAERES